MSELNDFKNQTIMVCGDVIADIYEYGTVRRLSREAPIPIVEFESERIVPGGAGNVVANITTLQGIAIPVSVIGDDEAGSKLVELFTEMKVDTDGLLQSGKRLTTTKRRLLAQGEHTVRQQILRLDRLPQGPLDEGELSQLWDLACKLITDVKAVIISDYHLPVMPIRFFLDILKLATQENKMAVVDTRHRLMQYCGATLLTPNRAEVEEALGRELRNPADLKEAGIIILDKTQAKLLLITLGDEGIALFEPDQAMKLVPAFNRLEVFDVSGAGDTVVATATLGLLAGMTPFNTIKFANIAAGLVVRKLGTATVSLEELTEELKLKNIE